MASEREVRRGYGSASNSGTFGMAIRTYSRQPVLPRSNESYENCLLPLAIARYSSSGSRGFSNLQRSSRRRTKDANRAPSSRTSPTLGRGWLDLPTRLLLTHSRFCSRRSCGSLPHLLARHENACEHQSQAANGVQTHWLVQQKRTIDQRHTGEKIGHDERARRTNTSDEPVVEQISQRRASQGKRQSRCDSPERRRVYWWLHSQCDTSNWSKNKRTHAHLHNSRL